MKYALGFLVFLGGEILALLIFGILKKKMGPPKQKGIIKLSTLKGILERFTLTLGLILGFPQILIAFGALKLGTRLHDEKESKISNNYFLIGNLFSMLLAMVISVLIKRILN